MVHDGARTVTPTIPGAAAAHRGSMTADR